MSLLSLLSVIDSGESITIFIDGDFLCGVNSSSAMNLLYDYHDFEVTNIETTYTKTCDDQPIIHLCVFLKKP